MVYGAVRLRPMNLGDLLDETFRLYRRHFLLFAGIGATLLIPFAVVQMVAGLVGRADRSGPIVVVFALASLLALVAAGAVYATITYAASELYLGNAPTIRSSLAGALRRWPGLLGLSLLYGLAVVAMLLTVIGIPFAIHFGIAWSFSYQALLIERVGPVRALGRSRALARHQWWRVLGIIIVFSIIQMVISLVFSIPTWVVLAAGGLTGSVEPLAPVATVMSTLSNTASQIFVYPFSAAGWVLLYYDLRVRKEGFDLELMARDAELAFEPGGAATG